MDKFFSELGEWVECLLGSFALVMLACALLLLDTGCGAPPPPRTISVRADLSDSIREAAYTAAAAWCAVEDQTHWCPEIVEEGGDAEIRADDFAGACENDTPEGTLCNGMHNDRGFYIGISPAVLSWYETDVVSILLAHEFGHFGIDGHVARSRLMRAVAPDSSEVDAPAVVEWCNQQGC